MDVQKDILKELIFGHFPGSLARILYPRRKPEDITYVEAATRSRSRTEFFRTTSGAASSMTSSCSTSM